MTATPMVFETCVLSTKALDERRYSVHGVEMTYEQMMLEQDGKQKKAAKPIQIVSFKC